MPRQISADVKDLIKRMLQTNPVKRITLSEIKRHRWFLQDLPSYLQELSRANLRNDNQVDKDVVRHLINIDQRIKKNFDEVCKDIADKRAIDYVGSYELIKHDKLKRECFAANKGTEGER